MAVQAACARLLARPGQWGEMECVSAIHAAADELAALGGTAAAELSTTLVVALLDAGAGTLVTSRVGDSTAMVLDPGEPWEELFPRDIEEELLTVTWALPSAGAPPLETGARDFGAGAVVVLMTDGVAGPLRDGPATVAPALADVANRARCGELGPVGLAEALGFSRRGAHDDRCVVMAWVTPDGR